MLSAGNCAHYYLINCYLNLRGRKTVNNNMAGEEWQAEPERPTAETPAIVMYTRLVLLCRVLCYIKPILITKYLILLIFSGSTGTPKGVVLTHGNMAFTLGAFLYNLDPLPDDMYIAYLPLAHVLELLGRRNKFEFLLSTYTLNNYSSQVRACAWHGAAPSATATRTR